MMVENPMPINDPNLWQDELTGYYNTEEASTEDGTMDYFELKTSQETIYDHTKELHTFFVVLKTYARWLGGSMLFDDLLEAYEEAGEHIAELKERVEWE